MTLPNKAETAVTALCIRLFMLLLALFMICHGYNSGYSNSPVYLGIKKAIYFLDRFSLIHGSQAEPRPEFLQYKKPLVQLRARGFRISNYGILN